MDNIGYKTSDLNIGSFLIASGEVTLVKTERIPDGTVYFYFAPNEKAQKLVDRYWGDQGPYLPPRKLFGARRDLQDLVFSGGV